MTWLCLCNVIAWLRSHEGCLNCLLDMVEKVLVHLIRKDWMALCMQEIFFAV